MCVGSSFPSLYRVPKKKNNVKEHPEENEKREFETNRKLGVRSSRGGVRSKREEGHRGGAGGCGAGRRGGTHDAAGNDKLGEGRLHGCWGMRGQTAQLGRGGVQGVRACQGAGKTRGVVVGDGTGGKTAAGDTHAQKAESQGQRGLSVYAREGGGVRWGKREKECVWPQR